MWIFRVYVEIQLATLLYARLMSAERRSEVGLFILLRNYLHVCFDLAVRLVQHLQLHVIILLISTGTFTKRIARTNSSAPTIIQNHHNFLRLIAKPKTHHIGTI
jgi:hypothetical protein